MDMNIEYWINIFIVYLFASIVHLYIYDIDELTEWVEFYLTFMLKVWLIFRVFFILFFRLHVLDFFLVVIKLHWFFLYPNEIDCTYFSCHFIHLYLKLAKPFPAAHHHFHSKREKDFAKFQYRNGGNNYLIVSFSLQHWNILQNLLTCWSKQNYKYNKFYLLEHKLTIYEFVFFPQRKPQIDWNIIVILLFRGGSFSLLLLFRRSFAKFFEDFLFTKVPVFRISFSLHRAGKKTVSFLHEWNGMEVL